tara:strand:+ start:181 stop:672 length:492 start_codon:yes stop_codon:yes gene_type:complete
MKSLQIGLIALGPYGVLIQALIRHQKIIKNVNLLKEMSLKGNNKKIRTMKTLKTILLLACLGSMGFIQAQTEPKPTTPVTNNFLDLQATTLGNIFGDSLTGGKGEVNGYLDLVNKSDMPEADKQNLRDAYLEYSKSLDAQGKDSLEKGMAKEFMLQAKKDTIK